MKPHEKARAILRAKDCFIKAAASLTMWPERDDALAMALLMGTRGLTGIQDADADGKANELLLAILKQVEDERAQAKEADDGKLQGKTGGIGSGSSERGDGEETKEKDC